LIENNEFEKLAERLKTLVPFNNKLGIQLSSVSVGKAIASLPFTPQIANHLGTLHASAIFAVAEAASGFAIAGLIYPTTSGVRAFCEHGAISYRNIARGRVEAIATVESKEEVQRLPIANKIDYTVNVSVVGKASGEVASALFKWTIIPRKKDLGSGQLEPLGNRGQHQV
jgi:acyl-coenzyme A thioesterase PaaI-like protein